MTFNILSEKQGQSLSSVIWTADERYFFTHVDGTEELGLYARVTSDNY